MHFTVHNNELKKSSSNLAWSDLVKLNDYISYAYTGNLVYVEMTNTYNQSIAAFSSVSLGQLPQNIRVKTGGVSHGLISGASHDYTRGFLSVSQTGEISLNIWDYPVSYSTQCRNPIILMREL